MFRNYSNYEVFSDGKILSYNTKRFLKPATTKNGYKRVSLSDDDGKMKSYYVHRIVYEAVTGSPIPEGYEINHIDERRDNNAKSNLQLISHKENINFGSRNARASKANTNNPKLSKPVCAFKDGELVMSFPSIMEARRQGFDSSAVSKCCIGKLKTHKGYTWKYI